MTHFRNNPSNAPELQHTDTQVCNSVHLNMTPFSKYVLSRYSLIKPEISKKHICKLHMERGKIPVLKTNRV